MEVKLYLVAPLAMVKLKANFACPLTPQQHDRVDHIAIGVNLGKFAIKAYKGIYIGKSKK
jgi:hypothetical protein